MSDLSEEKKRILADPARVIIVNACPGSGKTKLFVEKAIQEIEMISESRQPKGIAALSFTNAATDEILNRLTVQGYSGGYPNYVGTLDSFFQRFIVQPFASVMGIICTDGINLVPADNVEAFQGCPIKQLSSRFEKWNQPGINQYNLVMQNGKNIYRTKYNYKNEDFSSNDFDIVFNFKKWWWKKAGNVTHNDVRVIAMELFKKNGTPILDTLSHRFKSILIDECQDADGIISESLAIMVKCLAFKCFLVGDPDQSIFEFGGSNTNWLKQLADDLRVKPQTLSSNYRCPQPICNVSLPLSSSGHKMNSEANAIGRLILIEHSIVDDFSSLANWQKANLPDTQCAFLCHRNAILRKAMTGRPTCCAFSNALSGLHSASYAFNVGNYSEASIIIRKLLREILTDTFDEADRYLYKAKSEKEFLECLNICYTEWKSLSLKISHVSLPLANETWEMWRLRMQNFLSIEVSIIASKINISWGHKCQKRAARGMDICSEREFISNNKCKWLNETQFLTVHKAKGLEFDSVIYFHTKPGKDDICPSLIWFSGNSEFDERKRVGYVAFTRAKKNLIVCLHKDSVAAIKAHNANFLAMFDTLHVLK